MHARGYFLTDHHASGGNILLVSQVHQTVHGSWTYYLTPVAWGSQNPLNRGDNLALDVQGTYVAVQSWQGHPTISQITDGC